MVIAVLDTGAQLNHPGPFRQHGGRDQNLVNDTPNARDDNGHGTFVAGIIAARSNNGIGIAGISWTDKVMPVKIMDGTGTGSTADMREGIRWRVDQGLFFINMSVASSPYSQLVQDAVNYAWVNGIILVGAPQATTVGRRTVLPRELRQCRERQRHAAEGLVQQLVELGPRGRHLRPGLVGADHELLLAPTPITTRGERTPTSAARASQHRTRVRCDRAHPSWPRTLFRRRCRGAPEKRPGR